MPTKDPITIVGIAATLLLALGAVLLYAAPPAQKLGLTSPFKDAATPPAPETAATTTDITIPELSPAELQALPPEERAKYERLHQQLQQTLQQLGELEQQNNQLQQDVANKEAENKALDAAISKLPPPNAPAPH